MPDQAHLFVGVPITTRSAFKSTILSLGFTGSLNVDSLLDLDLRSLKKISVEGRACPIEVYRDSDDFEWASEGAACTDDTFGLIGVALTRRYNPVVLDKAHRHGRPDPFILDLLRLLKIEQEVQAQWPEARVLMMELHY